MITKGPNLIPAAKLAIEQLVHFNIPYVFVSNACMMESEKAEQLSTMLGVPVSCHHRSICLNDQSPLLSIQILAEQVVLAHTPMRCLTEYHNKHVLVCGQGQINDIARTYRRRCYSLM